MLGPNTCVCLGHVTKKQNAVSHSSTEAEIIALDATLRLDGLPALLFWDQVLQMFENIAKPNIPKMSETQELANKFGNILNKYDINPTEAIDNESVGQSLFAKLLDYVPGSLPKENSLAKLCILEDNEPVLKMAVKQRWPALRYVARTQRIDLDWLFERIAYDPGIMIRYVNTNCN